MKIQVIGTSEFKANPAFENWCHYEGVTIRAIERDERYLIPGVPRWMANTVPTIEWIREDGMLEGVYGNGETLEDAVRDLIAILSNKRVMIDMKDKRRVTCPKFGSPLVAPKATKRKKVK